MRITLIIAVTLLTSCFGGFAPRDTTCPDIESIPGEPVLLAIGDSSFAWKNQKCKTIPDIVSLELQREVDHRAVNGARFSGGEFPIKDQYFKGDWEWVILSGGGNDLNNECECGNDCRETLDRLISEDGMTGEIPTLVAKIQADGPRVLMYGYFEIGTAANYGFDECIRELDILRERQSKIPGVLFVDGRDVVTVDGTPRAYAFDDVHPSTEGSILVGLYMADAIRVAEEELRRTDTTLTPP